MRSDTFYAEVFRRVFLRVRAQEPHVHPDKLFSRAREAMLLAIHRDFQRERFHPWQVQKT